MRYLEDFEPGDVFNLGTVSLTSEAILEFSREYDPQSFHVDQELASDSAFGGLVASGWQVASAFMRRYVDGLLADSACEGSPGVDELRFLRPVRPGDMLVARITVLGRAPSLGKRNTGILRPRCELVAEDGTVVFSMILHSIFRCRPQDNEGV